MKSAMCLIALVLLASTVEHVAAFHHISEAIAETHAAIEEHIASKLLNKVAVSGPREVAVSGPRAAVSGARQVQKAPEKPSLHHAMIPNLGAATTGMPITTGAGTSGTATATGTAAATGTASSMAGTGYSGATGGGY